MRDLALKLLGLLYARVKASPRLSSLYYTAANAQFFGNLYEHEKMLADRVRVDTYHRAIGKLVQPDDVVVDLGTGTGVLALFAARHARKVYALEHGGIIELARKLARHNGLENVEFVRANSRSFQLEARADVIVHEQMGAALLDEHMAPNILDLRDRVLKRGGRILPNRFALYVEPVKLLDTEHVPLIWRQEIHGLRFDCLKEAAMREGGHGQRLIRHGSVEYLLCEPQPVLTFDLETVTLDALPTRVSYERPLIRDGQLDGFCMYFDASFDDEIGFTTSPFGARTHWQNPLFKVESAQYHMGDMVRFALDLGDVTDLRTYRWECSVTPGRAGPLPPSLPWPGRLGQGAGVPAGS